MLDNNSTYNNLLAKIKSQINSSQKKALLAVNTELILLYWNVGKMILEAQEKEGWGAKVIDNLADEIKLTFPEIKGFSDRNLKYMRKFSECYSDFKFVQQVVAQIPWGHNVVIMDKLNNNNMKEWYIRKTIENGWSRNTLVHQIESDLYSRQIVSEKTSNFMEKLPSIEELQEKL